LDKSKKSTGSVFVTGKFDGILGLSFPSLSAHAYTPVFDSIIKQKLLTNNMFSFYYSLLPKQNSAIMLGEPLRSMYTGPLTWISVSKPFYWEVNLIDIEYDGVSTRACSDAPCKAVIDTGTSLLTGPSAYTTKLLRTLGVDRGCNNMHALKKQLLIFYLMIMVNIVLMLNHTFLFYNPKLNEEVDNPNFVEPVLWL